MCDDTEPYGTMGDHGPYMTISDHMGPYLTTQDHIGPYGTKRDHIGPFRTMLNHTGPYGTIQDHKGPYGTIRDQVYHVLICLHFFEYSSHSVAHAIRNLYKFNLGSPMKS